MSTSEVPDVATYTVDAAQSRVGFTVRHMGFTKVRGNFHDFEATIRLDRSDLTSLSASATVRSASIATGDAKRDEHLVSNDFLSTAQYPKLSFVSKGVKDVKRNRFALVGDLTIRDVTNEVELNAKFEGDGKGFDGGRRIAFEARGTINRKEFGLTWSAVLEAGGFLVSEDVKVELEIQAVLESDVA